MTGGIFSLQRTESFLNPIPLHFYLMRNYFLHFLHSGHIIRSPTNTTNRPHQTIETATTFDRTQLFRNRLHVSGQSSLLPRFLESRWHWNHFYRTTENRADPWTTRTEWIIVWNDKSLVRSKQNDSIRWIRCSTGNGCYNESVGQVSGINLCETVCIRWNAKFWCW